MKKYVCLTVMTRIPMKKYGFWRSWSESLWKSVALGGQKTLSLPLFRRSQNTNLQKAYEFLLSFKDFYVFLRLSRELYDVLMISMTFLSVFEFVLWPSMISNGHYWFLKVGIWESRVAWGPGQSTVRCLTHAIRNECDARYMTQLPTGLKLLFKQKKGNNSNKLVF